MNTIEMLYLWLAAACLLAFIVGFSSGVWTTLHILQRWRRQWEIDREQRAAVASEFKAQETPPPLTVLHSNDSFERPA